MLDRDPFVEDEAEHCIVYYTLPLYCCEQSGLSYTYPSLSASVNMDLLLLYFSYQHDIEFLLRHILLQMHALYE